MSNHRFRLLEIEMIRRGVARRHARRAALELQGHHRQLADQAFARGEAPEQAERSAHEALGSDTLLIERYALQRELRSRAYRWRVAYVLAPLLVSVAVSVAAMVCLILIVSHLPVPLHHVRVPGLLTRGIDIWVSGLILWVIPVGVAVGFGALANRYRVALRWPLLGILVLCVIGALVNVQVIVTGGAAPGYMGAGIGFSAASLPHQLLRAVALAVLALIPVGWSRYRASSRRHSF